MTYAEQIEPPTVTRPSRGRLCVDLAIGAISDHNFWADLALDVASGGVFVATYRAALIGTIVDLHISLPDGGEPVDVSGVVRWTRPHIDGSDGVAGLGIKFIELTADARERVSRFAQSIREPIVFELENAPMRARSAA